MPNRTIPEYAVPDFRSMALITIDVQNDFLDGQPCEIPGTSQALPKMQQVAETFRRARLPVIHAVRLYKSDGSNVDLCRRSSIEEGAVIVRPGTEGAELAPPLLPTQAPRLDAELLLTGAMQLVGPNEWIFYKPRWGAFFGTSLEAHLRSLHITSLAFVGCNFPNCPRTSIYEASERDFRIVLVADAVSGLYNRGRDEMTNIGVFVMNAAEIQQAIPKV